MDNILIGIKTGAYGMIHKLALIMIIISLLFVVLADSSLADIGQIKTLKGEVYIIRDGAKLPAQLGDVLYQADVVETGAMGSVGITFIDNSRFSAGPDTRLDLEQFRFNPTTHEGEFNAGINRGTLSIISGQIAKRSPEAMRIKTPTTILGFRGTKILVKVSE
jgi:hypothetical protein